MGFLGITVLQDNALADAAPGRCGSDVAPMPAASVAAPPVAAALVNNTPLWLLLWRLLPWLLHPQKPAM